tara:strand:- start:348 stop:1010 length:663 start_codon:yes stop_codon:yes gene_type:complete
MKLTKEAVTILKNYSTISQNILITPGSILKTRSVQNTILSSTTVPDVFPIEFGIYDLNEFLGVLSLFSSPELEFTDKFVKISDGNTSIKYFSASASLLSVPKKDIVFPEPVDIEFKLSADTLALISKTASVLRAPDVSFVGQDGKLKLVVSDKKNETSNTFDIDVGETEDTFCVNIKVEMLKFLQADYTVAISSKRISRFTADGSDLVYYVGVESDSSFS